MKLMALTSKEVLDRKDQQLNSSLIKVSQAKCQPFYSAQDSDGPAWRKRARAGGDIHHCQGTVNIPRHHSRDDVSTQRVDTKCAVHVGVVDVIQPHW